MQVVPVFLLQIVHVSWLIMMFHQQRYPLWIYYVIVAWMCQRWVSIYILEAAIPSRMMFVGQYCFPHSFHWLLFFTVKILRRLFKGLEWRRNQYYTKGKPTLIYFFRLGDANNSLRSSLLLFHLGCVYGRRTELVKSFLSLIQVNGVFPLTLNASFSWNRFGI